MSARSSASERIDQIGRGIVADSRAKESAVDHIDAAIKQSRDAIFDADKRIDVRQRVNVEVDGDVDVALRPRLASGDRAKQRSMTYPELFELRAVLAERLDDSILVHAQRIMSAWWDFRPTKLQTAGIAPGP